MEQSDLQNQKGGERTKWSDEHTTVFMDLWENNVDDLRGPKRNVQVYERMAKDMKSTGMIVTGKEVKNKLDNMVRKYRHEKQNVGRRLSDWKHFNRVHILLGGNELFDLRESSIDKIDDCQDSNGNSTDDNEASLNWPVESESESSKEVPSRKRKQAYKDDRVFRQRMLQLAEERTAAIQQLVASTVRMEECMCRLLSLQGQNNSES